jgi:hypothetical protein
MEYSFPELGDAASIRLVSVVCCFGLCLC